MKVTEMWNESTKSTKIIVIISIILLLITITFGINAGLSSNMNNNDQFAPTEQSTMNSPSPF